MKKLLPVWIAATLLCLIGVLHGQHFRPVGTTELGPRAGLNYFQGAPVTANVPIAPDELAVGPKLWMKADAITGVADAGAACTWPDASGNGFDATEATNCPTFETSEINGWPVVRFDAVNDKMVSAGAVGVLNAKPGATIFTVFVPNAASTGASLWNISTAVGVGGRLNSLMNGTALRDSVGLRHNDSTFTQALGNDGSLIALGTPSLVTDVADVSTNGYLETYVGGTRQTSRPTVAGTGTFPATNSLSVTIGNRNDGALPSGSDIAEWVVFDYVLSAADRKGVEIYLACKYDLPLAYDFVCPALDLDASNIFGVADAGAVETWPDVSGNGFNATEATNTPDYVLSSTNGKPAVYFTAANTDRLAVAGAADVTRNVTGVTVIGVANYVNAGSNSLGRLLQFSTGSSSSATRAGLAFNRTIVSPGPTTQLQARRADGDGISSVVGTVVISQDVAHVFSSDVFYSTQTGRTWIDGASIADAPFSSMSAGDRSADTSSLGVFVGHNAAAANQFWNGPISKVQAFVPALSTVNRRAREAAMCRKYGLTCQ